MRESIGFAEYDWFRRNQADPKKVWIQTGYRVMLIKKGLEVAGSMNNLGRMMGYRSKRHPGWGVRQMLYGFQPFSMDRLEMLADIVDEPIEEILSHRQDPKYFSKERTNKHLRENDLWAYVLR
ncbi:MAG TPA: hypothetical protein ENN76_03730 [Euryarchaeota archaeon]|nr:hypothetical protein [Euryarchaeota archaeon]